MNTLIARNSAPAVARYFAHHPRVIHYARITRITRRFSWNRSHEKISRSCVWRAPLMYLSILTSWSF
jgi:hypothetical protein